MTGLKMTGFRCSPGGEREGKVGREGLRLEGRVLQLEGGTLQRAVGARPTSGSSQSSRPLQGFLGGVCGCLGVPCDSSRVTQVVTWVLERASQSWILKRHLQGPCKATPHKVAENHALLSNVPCVNRIVRKHPTTNAKTWQKLVNSPI